MESEVIETLPVTVSRMAVGGMAVSSPAEALDLSVDIAQKIAELIRQKNLVMRIQGREYVLVDGWMSAAGLVGLGCREAPDGIKTRDDGGVEVVVELFRYSDSQTLGRASSICGDPSDTTWAKRPLYARRSMALTRAAGKACRLAISPLIRMAGFETTPAEEMNLDGRQVPAANDKPITNEQALQIEALIGDNNIDGAAFLRFMEVEHVTDIPASEFDEAVKQLKRKINSMKAEAQR